MISAPSVRLTILFSILCFCSCLDATGATYRAHNSTNRLIHNAGQWADTISALYQTNGLDVWITRGGLLHDEYHVVDRVRIGRISFEQLAKGLTVRSGNSGHGCELVFVKGHSGDVVRTTLIVTDTITIRQQLDKYIQYTRNADGTCERKDLLSGTVRHHESHSEVSQKKREEGIQAKESSSFVRGSYFGGPGTDDVSSIHTLPNGDLLIAGSTAQLTYPESLGTYSRTISGNSDGFIAQVNPSFNKLYRWTYIGGSGIDKVKSIAVDRNRNVFIVSQTDSYDMPVSQFAQIKTAAGSMDAHVLVLDSTLSVFKLGFYHGGPGDDVPCCITADGSGEIVIAGTTSSTSGLPTTRPNKDYVYFPSPVGWGDNDTVQVPSGKYNSGLTDGFIGIYSSTGSIRAARYYGSFGADTITAMVTDPRGMICFAGTTTSENLQSVPIAFRRWGGRLPLRPGYQGGNSDGFVVKINRQLQLVQDENDNFVTYFGGDGTDRILGMTIDPSGSLYIVGSTTSDAVSTPGAIQEYRAGKVDGIAAGLRMDGSKLIGCTYWGGSGTDEILCVSVDTVSSQIDIGGRTYSVDFPSLGFGSVMEQMGGSDGFIASIGFQQARYSSLVPGTKDEAVVSIANWKSRDALFAVNTTSDDLPVTDSAVSGFHAGVDGYCGLFSPGQILLSSPKDGDILCTGSQTTFSWKPLGMPDSTKILLEYRALGSDNWTSIAALSRRLSYQWTVPKSVVSGRYEVRLSTQFGHASLLQRPITIEAAPGVLIRSTPTTECEGATIRMFAVTQTAQPVFQWRHNGVNLTGEIDSVMLIKDLALEDAGTYDCVVSDFCSRSKTSDPLTVIVARKPLIRSQPESCIVSVGAQIRLEVKVDGAGVSYQWFKDTVILAQATSPQFLVNKAIESDAGSYWCAATNACGMTVSDTVTVQVQSGTSVRENLDSAFDVSVLSKQPVSDLLLLECRTSAEGWTVCITDLRGRPLMTPQSFQRGSGASSLITIPIGHLEQGVVFVTVQSMAGVVSLPVLILR